MARKKKDSIKLLTEVSEDLVKAAADLGGKGNRILSYAVKPFAIFWRQIEGGKVAAVIPAYNEAIYVRKVVEIALATPFVNEVIVVDDGSTDGTARTISDLPVRIIRHGMNLGKGAAMRTGVREASADIILFLDADLQNMTLRKVGAILRPVLEGEADMARASFQLSRGRVTELAVKPLMRVIFPEKRIEQPISGQFCARKEVLEKMEIEDGWGSDISILLEAIEMNLRITEVDIGLLKHKARSLPEKAEMSEQVMRTMLKRAGILKRKYDVVAFDLDCDILI